VRILLRTNASNRVEVINEETGEEIKNIGRIDVHINWRGEPTVSLEFKNVKLHIEDIHEDSE
jgi:hypothetical protein